MERLQKELAKVHGADVKALDRALTSLCQHVDALELESKVNAEYQQYHVLKGSPYHLQATMVCLFSQGMSQGINSIETDLITPESIADELTALGLLTGGLVAVHHLIRLTPFRVGPCWHRDHEISHCGLCNWSPYPFHVD